MDSRELPRDVWGEIVLNLDPNVPQENVTRQLLRMVNKDLFHMIPVAKIKFYLIVKTAAQMGSVELLKWTLSEVRVTFLLLPT